MVTRFHKNIKLAFGSCSEEQRQHQKPDIRFNSPAVTVPRAGTNFTLFPLLSSSNRINGRNSARTRAEFLIPQGLYHFRTDLKKPAITDSQDQGVAEHVQEKSLVAGFTLTSKHSDRNLDANQAAGQTSTIKVRPRTGGKKYYYLPYFFLYIEWVSDVIWRQTEHLFLGLETQHTREC